MMQSVHLNAPAEPHHDMEEECGEYITMIIPTIYIFPGLDLIHDD